jgi:hypothetical protein
VLPPETIPGPDHVNPAPAAAVDAESVTDVVVQVRVPPVAPTGGPCSGTSTGVMKSTMVALGDCDSFVTGMILLKAAHGSNCPTIAEKSRAASINARLSYVVPPNAPYETVTVPWFVAMKPDPKRAPPGAMMDVLSTQSKPVPTASHRSRIRFGL